MPVPRFLGDVLMSPSERLVDPVERSTARLLAGCILAMGFVFALLDTANVFLRDNYSPPWQGYLFLAFSYGISRTAHYRAGAAAASLMFPAVSLSQVIFPSGNDYGPLTYAMLAPFFAGMFLGSRASAAFAIINLVGIAILPVVSLGRVRWGVILDPLIANLLAGVIAVSYAIRRDWLEQRRRENSRLQESQLLHMQKMEAIGRMAGGIAHDFNNLLTVIAGGIELLARHGNSKELKLIDSATNSARQLTSQLLTLSRQGVVEHASTDLRRLLGGMDQLLSRIIGEDIRLSVEVAPDTHFVCLDESQMHQIVLNLATNARDAMPRGGTVELVAQNVGRDRVLLTFSDTGIGMDEATRQRIFEPFFTTKSVGKGTGLGLSMVFGLVTQAGGEVHVESTVGKGTSFQLLIPRAAARQEESTRASERYLDLQGEAKGCILLVEDDSGVRELCRSVLRREGYEVLEASEPQEGIAVFREAHSTIDLVISDVVMPHMTGPEMVDVLRQEQPDVSVLYISGYAPESLGRGVDARLLLRKPFRPTELLRRVSALLYGLDSQAPPAVAEAVSMARIPVPSPIPTEPSPSAVDEVTLPSMSPLSSQPVSSKPAESGERPLLAGEDAEREDTKISKR